MGSTEKLRRWIVQGSRIKDQDSLDFQYIFCNQFGGGLLGAWGFFETSSIIKRKILFCNKCGGGLLGLVGAYEGGCSERRLPSRVRAAAAALNLNLPNQINQQGFSSPPNKTMTDQLFCQILTLAFNSVHQFWSRPLNQPQCSEYASLYVGWERLPEPYKHTYKVQAMLPSFPKLGGFDLAICFVKVSKFPIPIQLEGWGPYENIFRKQEYDSTCVHPTTWKVVHEKFSRLLQFQSF